MMIIVIAAGVMALIVAVVMIGSACEPGDSAEMEKEDFFEDLHKTIQTMETNYIGKKVIVRAYGAGVFYGTLKEKDGDEVVLTKARRIYHWDGASECVELAEAGCASSSRITREAREIIIEKVIEIHPCSDLAIKKIEAIEPWQYR